MRNTSIRLHLARFRLGLVTAIISIYFSQACSSTVPHNEVPPRIIDLGCSGVLDGGSYYLVLYLGAGIEPIRILVPNPTRRRGRRLEVRRIVTVLGRETDTALTREGERRLLLQLVAATGDVELSEEKRSACEMLRRILLHPEMAWNDVKFPWLLEALIMEDKSK